MKMKAKSILIPLLVLVIVVVTSIVHSEEASSTPALTFAVIGDYGGANNNEQKVANLVASWNPNFIITTGDNSYNGGSNGGENYESVVGNYYGTVEHAFVQQRIFWPSLGNHDYYNQPERDASDYLNYFNYLPGNKRYYDLDYGAIHFFILDSEGGGDYREAQKEWLQEALHQSNACYKIVVFNTPPYSTGTGNRGEGHGPNEDFRWPFNEWGVDLVLSGHEHNYQEFIVNNVKYVINGLGGAGRYGYGTTNTSEYRYFAQHGAMKVTLSSDLKNLTSEFYAATDPIPISSELPIRQFTLTKSSCNIRATSVTHPAVSLDSYDYSAAPRGASGPQNIGASSSVETRTQPRTVPSCDETVKCKEIDEAWQRFAGQNDYPNAEQAWDTEIDSWNEFLEIYEEEVVVGGTSSSSRSGSTFSPSQYDAIIERVAAAEGIEPVLQKAIIGGEASHPWAISKAGCVGLGQICYNTATGYDYLHAQACCTREEGEPASYSCTNERARCQGSVWCEEGNYLCNPDNDGRFDPELNLQASAAIIRGKMDGVTLHFSDDNEKIKATIAAYNLGSGRVNAAADLAGCGSSCSWAQVQAQLSNGDAISQERAASMDENTGSYLSPIYNNYCANGGQYCS